ncbi:glycosyltransferase family 4 protein [Bacteroides clarus]|uniref:Glycosyl transferase family 1 domain-containing protein n=1 Tax=Bacteroides clarus TaxID=626929 RepID=A0A1Y3YQA3_9BACE|nr:glycosyltransferase family 4 protein [Bacteroides clarus]OUN99896.1 hypothetical protein B5F97_15010 [Bacteroides clarus]
MKIAIITEYNPYDKFSRSGVVNSIYNQLLRFFDVIWINPAPQHGKRLFYYKILSKIIYWLHKCNCKVTRHLPIITNLYAAEIKAKLPQDIDALFFFDSYHFAKLNINKPIFFRNDSVFHQMINYYYFNIPASFIKIEDKIEYEAMNRMTALFSPSQWVKNGVHKFYPGNESKVYVIPSGANIYTEPEYSSKQLDINHIKLLFIGYQAQRKRVGIAANCAYILNKKYKIKTTLTIIGRDVPIEIQNANFVNYIGPINKNKDNEYKKYIQELKNADFLIFPTQAECAGIIVCEANAYGIPTISCNTGGVSNYVIHGINGFLLDVKDNADKYAEHIISIVNNGQYEMLSKQARELYLTKYNWNHWGNQVSKIIKEYLS